MTPELINHYWNFHLCQLVILFFLQFFKKKNIFLAYELRYLDEDDACKPDLTLEPLDETQKVYEYFLDSVVFIFL